jgi:hypothetical protein
LSPANICICVATIHSQAGIEVPKRGRTIPIHMNPGGFRFKPLPPSPDKPDTPRTEVMVCVSMDAARFAIPDHVISILMRVFAPLVHKSVLSVFTRMFHQPAVVPAGTGASHAHSSPSVCAGSMLRERMGLRPEYAALDSHAARVLAGTAAAGAARPLELYSPASTDAGAVA